MTPNDRIRKYTTLSKEPMLCLCAEFMFPMRKCEIQKLMQAFMLENGMLVRWVDGKPGKDQIKNF